MRSATAFLITLLLLTGVAAAKDPASMASATERGRSLARILDVVLAPGGPDETGARDLVIVMDPTESLKAAAFALEFHGALERNREQLGETRIGVARAGGDGRPVLAPTRDLAAAAEAVAGLSKKPGKAFTNVYFEVRRQAGALSGSSGRRDILLVTLENGDAEDDVEATASVLKRAGVRLFVIAREAFLSDTYWVSHRERPPRGLTLAGAESAFVEVPWGYLFQQTAVTEGVSSGFAMYGLSRIAASSGGKVYLFYPRTGTGHRCSILGGCIFCSSDHAPTGRGYQTHRLRALAPHGGSRSESYAAAGRDPYFRAYLKAWGRASKAGIVRSRPSVKLSGSSLQPEKRQLGSSAALTGSLNFSSQASRAERLAGTCGKIAEDLLGEIQAADSSGGNLRYRAIAELTHVLLLVTRTNLDYLAAFCREAAPVLVDSQGRELPPPELPMYGTDQSLIGIGYSTMTFCHGAAPFLSVRLPGGEAMDRELGETAKVVDGYLARHRHTPFAEALHMAGIARFTFTVRGKYAPPPRRSGHTSEDEDTATNRDRPERGGGSAGGGGTATSGD